MTVQILPGSSATYFQYDALGQRLAVTDALGHSAYFQYDATGQQTAAVDALGYVTYYYYDVLGRQYAVQDAAGGLVYYAYDVLGRRTALTDQRGNTSYFAYDAASRLISELDPLGNPTYYQYDADGNLIARTDGNGQTAYFGYDAAGRQISSAYASVARIYFQYDAAGRRALVLDEWGASYWSYDSLGRPVSRQDPRGTVVYYGYDASGNRTELGVLGQGTVYYSYDPAGRMASVLDGKTGLETTYDFDPAGRVTLQAHPNGATTYFSYDLAGRLSEKVTKKNADGSVLVQFIYSRDAAGNPISIEREAGLGVFYYQYDTLQRLAYEGQSMGAYFAYENYYQYDLAGNRTLLRHGETGANNLTYYDYNQANELTSLHDSSGWTYFSYDLNGNTIQEQTPSYTRYYDWDSRDMMIGVRSTEAGWTDNVYRYTGLGSRVSTLESSGLTYYDWDSINVLQEKDSNNQVTDRQVHGYAPIVSVGDIVLMAKSGTSYVPLADQVGTVWDLVDPTAALGNSYTYDAFGVGRSASEAVSNRYRFGAKRLDDDAFLYHFIARQYRSSLGRFLSYDWFVSGTACYTYASSRSVHVVDPLGLMPIDEPASETLTGFLDWDDLFGLCRRLNGLYKSIKLRSCSSELPCSENVAFLARGVAVAGMRWVYDEICEHTWHHPIAYNDTIGQIARCLKAVAVTCGKTPPPKCPDFRRMLEPFLRPIEEPSIELQVLIWLEQHKPVFHLPKLPGWATLPVWVPVPA
jgi:RHS repeat-associated protein